MVHFVTSKRITYFLMIRQLRFDKHDFVAAELERLFLNSLGNLDLFNLPPSDELERIIHSFSISSELLTNARSTLDYISYNAAPYGNPQLRKPNNHSSVNESDVFVVSQNNTSTPVIPRAAPRTDRASITFQNTSESPVQLLKRGRTVLSSSSSSVSTHDQELVSELKKISQELGNVDQVSQKQSPYSFISLKSSKVETPQCDTTLPQKTSSTCIDDLEIAADQAVGSEEKIVKITEDEASTRLSEKLPLEQVPPNSFISIKKNLESEKSNHIDFLQPSKISKEISKDADKDGNSCSTPHLKNIKSPESNTSQNQSAKLPEACCNNETVKISEDGDESVDTSLNPPSEITNLSKNGPSLTNDLNQKEKHTYEFKMPRYIRFSDFGRPEEFANCLEVPSAFSKKNLKPKAKIKTKETDFSEASASGSERPIIIQSDDMINSCSSNNTPFTNIDASLDILHHSKVITVFEGRKVIAINDEHSIEVRDNPDLHSMGYDDKLEVIKLLAKGWNNKRSFEKRVIKKCSCTEKCVLGEILHAVFGANICTFVLFKVVPENKNIHIRLHPSFYTDDHFEEIMSRLHCKNLQSTKETKKTEINEPSASGHDKSSQSNSIDSCSSKNLPSNSCSSTNMLEGDYERYKKVITVLKDTKVVFISLEHNIKVTDNPNLHSMANKDKLEVIKILAEGWIRELPFVKRVVEKVPCTEKCSLGEILYAVFGDTICAFVLFKVVCTQEHFAIRLQPCFSKDEHFVEILSIEQNLQEKPRPKDTGLNEASASGCDRPSQSNSKDSCCSKPSCSLNASPNVLNLDCDYDRRVTILDDNRVIVINSTNTIKVEDNPDLHNIGYNERVAVTKILAEGWKQKKTFLKRAKKHIPDTENVISLGNILYAVFGDDICTFVIFRTLKNDNFQVRLKPSYSVEHFERILSTPQVKT